MIENKKLNNLINKYNGNKNSFKKIAHGDNIIYSFIRKNEKYILRITSSKRRSINDIKAEIEWILFLNKNNGPAIKLIYDINNQVLQEFENQDQKYYAYCYKMIDKTFPANIKWNKNFFYKYGKLLGELHKLSRRYKPKGDIRYQWFEDDDLFDCLNLNGNDQIIANKCKNIIQKLKKVEKNETNYGLNHVDLHTGNIAIENNKIYAFDFDDIHYDFYVRDIAVVLYYAFWVPNFTDSILNQNPNDNKFINNFLSSFLKGYESQTLLNRNLLIYIPEYLHLQRIMLYTFLKQSNEKEFRMGIWEKIMNKWRYEIVNDIDYVNFDFNTLILD